MSDRGQRGPGSRTCPLPQPIVLPLGIGKAISLSVPQAPGSSLVRRNTRFALIERLPGVRDSATVIDVICNQIILLPEHLKKTQTWDQWQEMSRHKDLTITTGCPRVLLRPAFSPATRLE